MVLDYYFSAEEIVEVCSECGSPLIEEKAWIKRNGYCLSNDRLLGLIHSDECGEFFCPSCDEYTEALMPRNCDDEPPSIQAMRARQLLWDWYAGNLRNPHVCWPWLNGGRPQ